MPEEGIRLLRHEDILTFDEIADFTRIAVANGIRKVRITGGEPLVRKDIVLLGGMISEIVGITDLSMTTNGTLLEQYAADLSHAGLMRVNISLDTVDHDRYREITRTGNLDDVFRGIEAAKRANLDPVKINCVVRESKDERDAMEVARFCQQNGLEIRYISQMDLGKGYFSTVEGGSGGICSSCNRLRLTANGKLKPCLFNDVEIDIREVGNEEAFKLAVGIKPREGSKNLRNGFYNIGG
jgi:cyclic pyranopterin phosphate synthase